jgi:hypothetical protein
VIILLPRLRRLNVRTRLPLGLALTTIALFLIISALGHVVIAVIAGAIFLSVCRGPQRERPTYPSRSVGDRRLQAPNPGRLGRVQRSPEPGLASRFASVT